nr:MAG TPA: hypothetical protein [Caudoviricetes sp.]
MYLLSLYFSLLNLMEYSKKSIFIVSHKSIYPQKQRRIGIFSLFP